MLLYYGCHWGLWFLKCCSMLCNLHFHAKTAPNYTQDCRIRWVKTTQHSPDVCYVLHHLEACAGAEPSYFHCKTMIKYFRALEDRNTTTCSLFVPKSTLSELLDSENICSNWPLILWFLSKERNHEGFYMRLTFLLLSRGCHRGFYVSQYCRRLYILHFRAKTVPT